MRQSWALQASRAHRLIQNGDTLALAMRDGGIALLDVATGRERGVLRGHTGRVTCLAELPQRNLLVSGSDDRTLRLWDLNTMEELCVLRGHTDKVWDVVVSPDGKTIFSGSGDYTIRRWGTRPLRDLLRARDEYSQAMLRLEPMVGSLFLHLHKASAVADRIEQDSSLADRDRQIALQLVLEHSSAGSNH